LEAEAGEAVAESTLVAKLQAVPAELPLGKTALVLLLIFQLEAEAAAVLWGLLGLQAGLPQ
jgi:hypothetical protein